MEWRFLITRIFLVALAGGARPAYAEERPVVAIWSFDGNLSDRSEPGTMLSRGRPPLCRDTVAKDSGAVEGRWSCPTARNYSRHPPCGSTAGPNAGVRSGVGPRPPPRLEEAEHVLAVGPQQEPFSNSQELQFGPFRVNMAWPQGRPFAAAGTTAFVPAAAFSVSSPACPGRYWFL